MSPTNTLRVAIAQISPVWMQRELSIDKITEAVRTAAAQGAQLVAFGETLLPGYPFWLEHTGGARFDNAEEKALFAWYAEQAVCIEQGHLDSLCAAAKQSTITIVVGIIERPSQRGGHSLYCSCVYIDNTGQIRSVHRKLMPTYEERLVWSQGDGHGLSTQALPPFTVGALNCWENWMPMPRAALYAQGEDLHIALWPGNVRNTVDITRFIARESRSYVLSVSGVLHTDQIPKEWPFRDLLLSRYQGWLANGGSCIAQPDGEWLLAPTAEKEFVQTFEIDHAMVRRERQNFDPSGHYSRPDVLSLQLNRVRQTVIKIDDN